MEMIELGYNIQLKRPFDLLNNVIAVSGRCAHNMYNCNGIGKLGTDIEKPINLLNVNRNQFYVF